MKTNAIFLQLQRYWLAFFVAIIFSVALSACARRAAFETSTVLPEAQGKVKVKEDNNRNYDLTIELQYLAESDRLIPAKKMYVIWIETDKHLVQNIGLIKSETHFLSNKLANSVQIIASYKPIKVFITAENDANVLIPGTQLVLTTRNF